VISEGEIGMPTVESQGFPKPIRSSSTKPMRLSPASVCWSDGLALLRERGGTHKVPFRRLKVFEMLQNETLRRSREGREETGLGDCERSSHVEGSRVAGRCASIGVTHGESDPSTGNCSNDCVL
jgi:hypothetical protein